MNKLWTEFQVSLSESAILRWCLLFIVLIILFESYFQVKDARLNAAVEMEANQVLYFENADAGSLDAWNQYLSEVNALNSDLKKLLWVADTEGEGRALVQKELNNMLSDLEIRNLRTRIGSAVKVSDNPVIWEVQFQINAKSEVEASLQLAHRISRQNPVLVIKDLRIDSTRNNLLSLIGVAYFSSDWS